MISYLLLPAALILYSLYLFTRKRRTTVPMVKGALPFVGHGLAFSRDNIGFIKRCKEQYGDLFAIKIFNRDIVIMADSKYIKDYGKYTEDTASLYEVLIRLYFADAFFDNPNEFPTSINIVRKTVAVKFDEFAPKILDEATKAACGLATNKTTGIDLIYAMTKFVAKTSSRCFIGVDMDDTMLGHLMSFTKVLNRIVVLTYFLPRSIIKSTVGRWFLDPYRYKMRAVLAPEIEKYRHDKTLTTSALIRVAVDSEEHLSNAQIADIIVCLLYVSSENTALGLTNSLIDLAHNPDHWYRLRKELAGISLAELYKNKALNDCIMETARLNSHIFALNRKPQKAMVVDGYVIDTDVDAVALCPPLIMRERSLEYDPLRFNTERSDANSIITWGPQGMHLCPGKIFALYEIKTAIALIVGMYDPPHVDSKAYNTLNYFSPSAFAERKIEVSMKRVNDAVTVGMTRAEVGPQKIGERMWLLRQCISAEQQIEIYRGLLAARIYEVPSNKSIVPFVWTNLIYTGSSNATPERLTSLTELADKLAMRAIGDAPVSGSHGFHADAVYSQMFRPHSTMVDHYDKYVDWGVSISIGTDCDFTLDGQKIRLAGGDVLVGDFAFHKHGVTVGERGNNWFTDEVDGFARLSIQVRSQGHVVAPAPISEQAFAELY